MAIEEVISAQAVARYIRMSPTKVRRVLNQIRGCTYEEALILLEFLPFLPFPGSFILTANLYQT